MGIDDGDEPMRPNSPVISPRKLEYTYHIPALPRVNIPPLVASSDVFSHNLKLVENEHKNQNLSFLKDIDFGNDNGKKNHHAWKYSQRREAQKILPYLYLGPIIATRDKEFLKREKFTMFLAVRYRHGQSSNHMAGAAQAAADLEINYECLDIQSPSDIIRSFSKSVDLINQHMSNVYSASISENDHKPTIGKILVFCESGNDISAAIVSSYLMSMLEGIDYVRAIQLCQACRFSAHFNELTKSALQSYWEILRARRDVTGPSDVSGPFTAQATGVSGSAGRLQFPHNGKRSLLDDDPNGDEMDSSIDLADAARFEGRSMQPFCEVADS